MPTHSSVRRSEGVPLPPVLLCGSQANARSSRARAVAHGRVAVSSSDGMDDLLDVKRRLLRDMELAKRRDARSVELLQIHRKRAWDIAFGKPGGDDIEVSTMEFSLYCPYSRTAMYCPVRGETCLHVQCCDLESWITLFRKQRSLRDRRAPCPVCKGGVLVSSLEVDLWQLHVLSEMPQGTQKLVLNADGSYCSGDISRKQRKEEEVTEVLDMTQTSTQKVFTEEGTGVPTSVSSSAMPDAAFSKSEFIRVKRERHSLERLTDSPSLESDASLEATPDDDVVVVQYEAPAVEVRVLPSQLRLWTAHCPKCKQEMSCNSEDASPSQCGACGVEKSGWTLVRRFPNSHVTLELTGDGTILLRGVDAMAPYLWRAGFNREVFVDPPAGAHRWRGVGVWYSTFRFTRYELDFVEACCERVSRNEAVGNIPETPWLFRVPGQRRSERFSQLSLSGSGR
ncbi:MIZ/SP-RING zinc finger, putative [Trypanosoma equiperdum]|uniref:MIZ/SP-RING zinc finger, putative n=1 Tax=Trypanosoma equiperdum TaxID=5694 RepID=A0A1G4IL52_TRYEQ|nr:MIZ/SP-RING zinc finger, putative [Trypanosoma equiperdum]